MKNTILLTAWLMFWMGMAYGDVGKPYIPLNQTTWDWTAPAIIGGFLGVTAFLGFMAGRESRKSK